MSIPFQKFRAILEPECGIVVLDIVPGKEVINFFGLKFIIQQSDNLAQKIHQTHLLGILDIKH